MPTRLLVTFSIVLALAAGACGWSDGSADDETASQIRRAVCEGTVCDDECVSLLSDPDNCGSCGNVCAETSTCLGGYCVR